MLKRNFNTKDVSENNEEEQDFSFQEYEAESYEVDPAVEFDLNEAIDILDNSDDWNKKQTAIADVIDCAFRISEKNWDRGCEIVKNNLPKYNGELPDDAIGDIIDIAIRDPRLQAFAQAVNATVHSDFKQLRNKPEIIAMIPDGSALALMDLAEAHAGRNSRILVEVQFMRDKMDPRYDEPLSDTFEMH